MGGEKVRGGRKTGDRTTGEDLRRVIERHDRDGSKREDGERQRENEPILKYRR